MTANVKLALPGRMERWLYRRRLGSWMYCRTCSGTGYFGLTANHTVCHGCGGHRVVGT